MICKICGNEFTRLFETNNICKNCIPDLSIYSDNDFAPNTNCFEKPARFDELELSWVNNKRYSTDYYMYQ